MTTKADQLRSEIKRRYVDPGNALPISPPEEEPEVACDLCSTLWPEDALENGVCPDCLADHEED